VKAETDGFNTARILRKWLSAGDKAPSRSRREIQNSTKGNDLMKTITNCEARHRKRALWLSLLCAGVVATFLSGCAEGPYMTAYDSGYYYPTAYYTPNYYDYYGYPYSYYRPYTRSYTTYHYYGY